MENSYDQITESACKCAFREFKRRIDLMYFWDDKRFWKKKNRLGQNYRQMNLFVWEELRHIVFKLYHEVVCKQKFNLTSANRMPLVVQLNAVCDDFNVKLFFTPQRCWILNSGCSEGVD